MLLFLLPGKIQEVCELSEQVLMKGLLSFPAAQLNVGPCQILSVAYWPWIDQVRPKVSINTLPVFSGSQWAHYRRHFESEKSEKRTVKHKAHDLAFWIARVCDIIYISDKSGSESSVLRLHRIVTIGNERSNAHSYEGLLLFVLPWPPEGQNWPSKCENTRILLVVSFFEVYQPIEL